MILLNILKHFYSFLLPLLAAILKHLKNKHLWKDYEIGNLGKPRLEYQPSFICICFFYIKIMQIVKFLNSNLDFKTCVHYLLNRKLCFKRLIKSFSRKNTFFQFQKRCNIFILQAIVAHTKNFNHEKMNHNKVYPLAIIWYRSSKH